MVVPVDPHCAQSMTPEEMAALDKISKKLFDGLKFQRELFLVGHMKLNFVEQTYVVVNAAAALIADCDCSQEAANKSPFDIPTSISASVEILQHHYMKRQNELYDRFGRFVH